VIGSRVGELELERAGQLRLPLYLGEPWDGRSPRALTRGHVGVILKAQAEKSVSDFVSDENQLDLWVTVRKAPSLWEGAPSLFPFPWEV